MTATFTQAQNVSVTNISFLQNLLNGGVPGSGVPLVIQIVVTCTPAPTTPPPPAGGTGGTGGGTTALTPAQQRSNLNKSAADLILGGSRSYVGGSRAAFLLTGKQETLEEELEREAREVVALDGKIQFFKDNRKTYSTPAFSPHLTSEEEDEAERRFDLKETARLEKLYAELTKFVSLKRRDEISQRRKEIKKKRAELRKKKERLEAEREHVKRSLKSFERNYQIGLDGLKKSDQSTAEKIKILNEKNKIAQPEFKSYRQYIKNLDEKLEEIDKSEKAFIDELFELNEEEGKVHSVRDEVQGVFVPAGFPARTGPISDPRALRLTRKGDKAASFVVDLKQAMVSPAAGHVPVLPQNIDIWFAGKVSILEDGSSANRSGYVGNVSFGAARKISDKIALAVELTARSGQVDINQLQSNTDFKGVGLALSAAFAITEKVIFSISGSYERGSFDTSLAGATGSFNSDDFGANASLSGTFQSGEYVLQPGLAVTYSSTKLSSYTDSTAVFVPGQTTKNGNFNSSLTISRTFDGGERLVSWQPYATGRLNYAFNKERNLAISPTLIVNDSRFNGEIGGGAQFNFPGDIKASIGVTYFGLFGQGANAINFGVNLTVPLN